MDGVGMSRPCLCIEFNRNNCMRNEDKRDTKLNIAMFGQKRIPSREGGIEVVVEELCVRMVQLGYEVTCYNRTGHHVSGKKFDSQSLKEYKGIKLKNVLTISCKGLAAMTSSISAAICTAFGKYDIVHIHAEGPSFMCWLPKLFGKKIVVTVHGLDHQRAKWGRVASSYIMHGEKNAVKFADRIIVLSENVQTYFKEVYHRDTYFIPNGVNCSQVKTAQIITEKFNLKKDDYILFLGRLVPEKGLRYLIQAYKQVKTDKKLVIAGGSSDTALFATELREMSKDDDRIMFTGFVCGQMLEELYSNAYLYALPSDLEGMPLSLLEAMSYGNCCVVSDIAECTSVVEDKAVTFCKGDVLDLQSKLQMLCDHAETVRKYKEEAADFICRKYSWDDVVRKTLDTYEGIEDGKCE